MSSIVVWLTDFTLSSFQLSNKDMIKIMSLDDIEMKLWDRTCVDSDGDYFISYQESSRIDEYKRKYYVWVKTSKYPEHFHEITNKQQATIFELFDIAMNHYKVRTIIKGPLDEDTN